MSNAVGKSRPPIILVVVTALVVLTVGVGLFLIDSPAQERNEKQDKLSVNRLQNIVRALEVYWEVNARLPDTMGDLVDATSWDLVLTDAGLGKPFEFNKLGSDKAELCAFFLTESKVYRASNQSKWRDRVIWTHDAGRKCFSVSFKLVDD